MVEGDLTLAVIPPANGRAFYEAPRQYDQEALRVIAFDYLVDACSRRLM
jgi:hypothetical protein